MRRRPIFLLLAGVMALTLTACKTGDQPSEPTPVPSQPPAPTVAPAPEPTPVQFRVQEADVPTGEYAPWQEGYAAFLVELRQKEGELKNWIDTAPDQEINEDMERWIAYNDASDSYSLYDVDKDGIPELFVCYGNCEAAYHTICYAFRDGQVVEAGEFHSGHSRLDTWPGENAVLFAWGHMGSAYWEKYSMVDGVLTSQGEIFSELIWGTDQEEYTRSDRLVPGAEYIPPYRTPTQWRPGDSPALLLPIYDYGAYPRQDPVPMEEGAVRAAIGKILWEGAELYGVSGDGFDGDTGWTTLADYLKPGAASPYKEEPLTVTEYAWADVNGDGQTDCVLHLDNCYTVLSVEEGTVYAYFLGFNDSFGVDPDGSVYLRYYEWWKQVSFYKNQCYDFTAPRDPVEGCDLAWDPYSAENP